MNPKVIIIGGGASGLMLASLLPKKSALLIESNNKVGAKIDISGGGKCNITNQKMGTEYFLAKSRFIRPSLHAFSNDDLLLWLKKHKLVPVIRKKGQYFCNHSASQLTDIFKKEIKKQHLLLNETVYKVSKKERYFNVHTKNRIYSAEYIVVASGGLSFPKLGASGIGYEIARFFGHTIKKPAPALVGLTLQKEQFFFKELSGISCGVHIKVDHCVCKGALLFTHRGISGPAVLDASLYWTKGEIEIDFLPDFSWEKIAKSTKYISSLLPLPKRLTKAFLLKLGLQDKAYCTFTRKEAAILQVLNRYRFAPAGTFGYTKAEVTKGGIETAEIDSDTMMSKKVENLYFIGEILDVTGRLGGYNFQWAFSSAYASAKSITHSLYMQ